MNSSEHKTDSRKCGYDLCAGNNLHGRDIFCAAGLIKMTVELPCDLMLRKETNTFTPVIFLNKELPDVLSCISRELKLLHAESCLTRKISGRITAPDSGPLALWYKCIFGDLYRDSSREEFTLPEDRSAPGSFYIQGDVLVPKRLSDYQYVTLTLPPLWQKHRRVSAQTGVFTLKLPPMSNRQYKHKLFMFRYFADTGLWYAMESQSRRKKKIVQ